jgi:hypothetical protein
MAARAAARTDECGSRLAFRRLAIVRLSWSFPIASTDARRTAQKASACALAATASNALGSFFSCERPAAALMRPSTSSLRNW